MSNTVVGTKEPGWAIGTMDYLREWNIGKLCGSYCRAMSSIKAVDDATNHYHLSLLARKSASLGLAIRSSSQHPAQLQRRARTSCADPERVGDTSNKATGSLIITGEDPLKNHIADTSIQRTDSGIWFLTKKKLSKLEKTFWIRP